MNNHKLNFNYFIYSFLIKKKCRDLKEIGFKLQYVLIPKNIKEGKGS